MKPALLDVKPSSPMLLVEYGPIAAADQVDPASMPDGLLAAHTLTTNDSSRNVLTYWATEADFRRDGGAFGARFTPGASATPRGYVGAPIARPKPWYKRGTPWTWILSLTTLLGAFDALFNRYETWFSAPQVFIKPETGDLSVQHAVQNIPINLRFSLRNPLDVALRDVRVTAVLQPAGVKSEAECGDCRAMVIDEHASLTLPPGDSMTLVAQLPNANNLKHGRWEVDVQATVSAGYARKERLFNRRVPVEIWLPLSVVPMDWASHGQQAGVLSGLIKVGVPLPKGMSCTAIVQGIGEPRSGLASLLDVYGNDLIKPGSFAWPRAPGESGAKQYKMNWETVPVDRAFSDLYFKMIVQGPADTDWVNLTSTTTVECFPNN